MIKNQPWIFSEKFDSAFILAPAIIITLIVIIFSNHLESAQNTPAWLWLLLVVGVDVSHVYSTIFRTYLDRTQLKNHQTLYILTPLFIWVSGCFLYSISALLFWRVLAYLAVFHFVRQQYGFMMIYSRKDYDLSKIHQLIDKAAIYIATIYPLVYWHCHSRNFEWFVADDFIAINSQLVSNIFAVLYLTILLAYLSKEILLYKKTKFINLPKNLLLFGTAFSWFFGIVAFNNDLAFTATNIIAHGIPYMALIWGYGKNQTAIQNIQKNNSYVFERIKKLFELKNIPFYIAIIFILAFLEEWLWDGLVWNEHRIFFQFPEYFSAANSPNILIWLVPLLALPQATHYILDAFIWSSNFKNSEWKSILFYQTSASLHN